MAFEALGGRRVSTSHGAEWLLVDEALLMELMRGLDGASRSPKTQGSAKDSGVIDHLGGKEKSTSGSGGPGVCEAPGCRRESPNGGHILRRASWAGRSTNRELYQMAFA